MLSLLVSTLVFFVTSWYIKRYLEEQEIPKGMTRGVLIFTIAALVSWGAGALVNRMQGPQPGAKSTSDLAQFLKPAHPAKP